MARIRVLVVEDEGLFRDMLTMVLSHQLGIEVVGHAASGEDSIRLAAELGPDVVLMDIQLEGAMNGIEAAHRIRAASPGKGIVILSMHRNKEYIASLPQYWASGWSYLLKQNVQDTPALVRAIEGSAEGLVVMDPTVVQELQPRPRTGVERLTPRQMDVVRLIAQGYSNTGIADGLVVSPKSVENLTDGIFQEMDVPRDGPVNPRVMVVLMFLQDTRGL